MGFAASLQFVVPDIEVPQNLRIAILLEMLEEVSRATEPEQATQAYAARIGKLRPVDGLVSVSVRNLPPGKYKITRRGRAAESGGAIRHRVVDP